MKTKIICNSKVFVSEQYFDEQIMLGLTFWQRFKLLFKRGLTINFQGRVAMKPKDGTIFLTDRCVYDTTIF